MVQTDRRRSNRSATQDTAAGHPLTLVPSDEATISALSVALRTDSPTDQIGAAAAGFVFAWSDSARTLSPQASVLAAEYVSASRAILYRCLIDLGWTPPVGVLEGMLLDEQLSHEGVGGCYEGIPAHTPGRLATAVLFTHI
jgi:hypothetical protein